MKEYIFTTLLYLANASVLRHDSTNQIDKFVDELDSYYGPHPILDETWRYDMHPEGIERLAQRMRKDKFVVGVIGSSVAAGHDNCNYDSYEKQLERTLQPLFSQFGKTIEVRNAGEGGGCGDSYRNQIFCMRNLVGDDVDAIHYTWTYFEAGDREIAKWHETYIRWSLLMNNAPVPFIVNVGKIKGSEHLFDQYKKFGYNVLYLEKALKKYYKFQKAWGKVGDGIHNKTRYGGDGVMFRNWHPGPLGFQLVADTIAKVYAKALKIAVTKPARPELGQLLSQADLPKPVACNKEWCGTEEPPGCVNFEEPTHGNAQIRVVTPETDDLFPYNSLYTENNDWVFSKPAKSSLMPRQDRNRPECQHLDYCSGYMSNSEGWITLRLPRMTKGLIYVCCSGKVCGNNLQDFEFILDGHQLDHHNIKTGIPSKKCAQILDGFHGDLSDSSGHLYLGIKGGEKQVKLSHVIAL